MIKCKDCKYYDKTNENSGTCHKNPPNLPFQGMRINYDGTKFPNVLKNDWCGQAEAEK
jgi:hypothetical protein